MQAIAVQIRILGLYGPVTQPSSEYDTFNIGVAGAKPARSTKRVSSPTGRGSLLKPDVVKVRIFLDPVEKISKLSKNDFTKALNFTILTM